MRESYAAFIPAYFTNLKYEVIRLTERVTSLENQLGALQKALEQRVHADPGYPTRHPPIARLPVNRIDKELDGG